MHHSGGSCGGDGGGGLGHGHSHGHSGHGHSGNGHSAHNHGHVAHGHGGEGEPFLQAEPSAMNIGSLLGLNSSHGIIATVAHALGLAAPAQHHPAATINPVAPGDGAAQTPEWAKNLHRPRPVPKRTFKLTPAFGFLCLFAGMIFWLQVIYFLRHHEPTENFAQLSNQLYTKQLPTTKLDGHRLDPVGTQVQYSNPRPAASAGAGFAAEPITSANPDLPVSAYNNQYSQYPQYNQFSGPSVVSSGYYAAPVVPSLEQSMAGRQTRMRVYINR